MAALPLAFAMNAQAQTTMAHWSFNYGYTIANGVGTPNSTAITGNGSVNLHDVQLKPNETFIGADEATLKAHRPTIATQANQVSAQDNKGAYHEVNAINCDGAALHMTSPVPTSVELSTSFTYGDNTTAFPDGQSYGYQNPYNYFEIEANTKNYKETMELELKAAGHNSQTQYYAVAYSMDKATWTIVGDEYLTGASYNRWENTTVSLPIGKQEKVYVRSFPAKNWKGAGSNVNSDNQFDLDDVWLRGEFDAKLAQITGISVGDYVAAAGDKQDFELRLPKTYTEATTTITVNVENATLKVSAEEEDSGDDVDVTANADGTFTVETPRPNNAHLLTFRLTAADGAITNQTRYTFRLFHAGDLQVRNLFIDGVAATAALRNALNSSEDFTATFSDNVYTALPTVTATFNDGTQAEVTSTYEAGLATFQLKGADRTFTLKFAGVYI